RQRRASRRRPELRMRRPAHRAPSGRQPSVLRHLLRRLAFAQQSPQRQSLQQKQRAVQLPGRQTAKQRKIPAKQKRRHAGSQHSRRRKSQRPQQRRRPQQHAHMIDPEPNRPRRLVAKRRQRRHHDSRERKVNIGIEREPPLSAQGGRQDRFLTGGKQLTT